MDRCITPRPIPPYQSHFDLSARSGLDCETLRQNAKVSEDRSKTRMFRKLCEILTQDGLGWLRLTQTGAMWPSGCRRRTKSGAPACCCSSLPEDIFSDLKFFLRIHFDGKIFICVRSNLNLSVSIGKYAFRSVRIEISPMRWCGICGGIRLFAIQKSEGLLQAINIDPPTAIFSRHFLDLEAQVVVVIRGDGRIEIEPRLLPDSWRSSRRRSTSHDGRQY